MSRNNTGNPIGSKAFADFDDNVKNLDVAVNSEEAQWLDRFGRPRLPLMEQERRFIVAQESRSDRFNDFISSSGYQFVGDYGPGIEITEYNQLIRDSNGEFWRVSGQVDLPYVTTGAGIPEGDALVPAGDAVLRQDLANPDKGAAMVAYAGPGGAEYSLADLAEPDRGAAMVARSSVTVPDQSDVAGLPKDMGLSAHLSSPWSRSGYTFMSGDLSALVSSDALGLVSVPPKGQNGSNGAFVRNPHDVHDFNLHGNLLRKVRRGMAETSKPLNLTGPVVGILGDSISHGAFSRDIYRNNWTNIVKRAILNEYGSASYGFQSLVSGLGSGATLSMELAVVARGGFVVSQGEDAQESISGMFFSSSSAGTELSFSVDANNRQVGVWYYAQSGNGSFVVEINGVDKFTRNTGFTPAGNYAFFFDTEDSGNGICNIKIRTTSSAPVKLSGISIHADHSSDPMVCNWSQSGRRLRWVAQEVLAEAAKCDTLIFALGHNDAADVESDEAYFAAVQQRIDWLIDAVRSAGTQLYVLDFCWNRWRSSKMRQELLRLHRALPTSQLVAFPEYFRATGAPPNTSYLTTDLGLFDDSSHPNIEGHKIIGETVCRAMGLGITTKAQSLDVRMPRAVQLAEGWKNAVAGYAQVASYCVQAGVLYIRMLIAPEAGGAFGDKDNVLVGTIPPEHAPKITQSWPISLLRPGGVTETDGVITVTLNGEIRITTEASTRTSLPLSLVVPLL